MTQKINTQGALEDFKINVKLKLFALWTSVTLCYLYGDYFELYVPKKAEGLVSGENILNSPTRLFLASILLAIPALMAFISLILKPAINRIVNLSLGTFYTLLMCLIAISSLTPWRTFYVFLALVESILTSLIVWHAFKWPRH